MMDFIYNHNSKETNDTWNDVFEKALRDAIGVAATPELKECQILVVKSTHPWLEPYTVSVLVHASETKDKTENIRKVLSERMQQ